MTAQTFDQPPSSEVLDPARRRELDGVEVRVVVREHLRGHPQHIDADVAGPSLVERFARTPVVGAVAPCAVEPSVSVRPIVHADLVGVHLRDS
ncbi:hypothetical protein FA014_03825 [Cellulomonas hominis]|uniref:Uncharacterized protein n=1 Tax=Cellulomonas hominis TaxID=156981 RepID=A0A7Z8K121_9CELL|nr:hypothetical protein [Cellulomonas hominis]TKR26784.1 hypothetical protein FA014_03825 [Cellulomonas hominis]